MEEDLIGGNPVSLLVRLMAPFWRLYKYGDIEQLKETVAPHTDKA